MFRWRLFSENLLKMWIGMWNAKTLNEIGKLEEWLKKRSRKEGKE